MLNPCLGKLNDGGYAFQQWRQQGMLPYRRGQWERHVKHKPHSDRHNPKGQHSPAASPTTAGTTPTLRDTALAAAQTRLPAPSGPTAPTTRVPSVVHHNNSAPPSAHGTPATAITVEGSTTQPPSTPKKAHMLLGPTQHGGNKNPRQPGTFCTILPVDGEYHVENSPAASHATVSGTSQDARALVSKSL